MDKTKCCLEWGNYYDSVLEVCAANVQVLILFSKDGGLSAYILAFLGEVNASCYAGKPWLVGVSDYV